VVPALGGSAMSSSAALMCDSHGGWRLQQAWPGFVLGMQLRRQLPWFWSGRLDHLLVFLRLVAWGLLAWVE
jgi:hypothetical protein